MSNTCLFVIKHFQNDHKGRDEREGEKRRRNETGDLWQESWGYELYLQQVVFQIISADLPRGFGWFVCLFCFVSLYTFVST